jgi:hypothetical protein
MKTKIIVTSFLDTYILSITSIQAQVSTLAFANSKGSTSVFDESSSTLKVLSTENIIATGYFSNSINLGGTTLSGYFDTYMASISISEKDICNN